MRMCDLVDSIVLSRSGLTRLVDRLERDGLIARVVLVRRPRRLRKLTPRGSRGAAGRARHASGGRARALPRPASRGGAGELGAIWERLRTGRHIRARRSTYSTADHRIGTSSGGTEWPLCVGAGARAQLAAARDEPAVQHLLRHAGDSGEQGGAPRRWVPAMDLVEADDHFVLRADLPGLDDEDVSIEVDGRRPDGVGRAQGRARGARRGLLPHRALLRRVPPLADAPEGVDAATRVGELRQGGARGPHPQARGAQAAQASRSGRRASPATIEGTARRRRPARGRRRAAGPARRWRGPVARDPPPATRARAPAPASCSTAHGDGAHARLRPAGDEGHRQGPAARRGRRPRLRHGPGQHVPPVPRPGPRADRAASAACTSSWAGTRPIITDSGGFQVFSMGHGTVADEVKGRAPDGRRARRQDPRHRGGRRALPLLPRRLRAFMGPETLDGGPGRARAPTSRSSSTSARRSTSPATTPRARPSAPTAGCERCLDWHDAHGPEGQLVYGIVQGGVYEDLREESAEAVAAARLRRHRDRRLARRGQAADVRGGRLGDRGAGRGRTGRAICSASATIDDLVRGVELGIDTFDCAMPTRLGRHGMALVPEPARALARRPHQGALAGRRRAADGGLPVPGLRGGLHARLPALPRQGRELTGDAAAHVHNLAFVARRDGRPARARSARARSADGARRGAARGRARP